MSAGFEGACFGLIACELQGAGCVMSDVHAGGAVRYNSGIRYFVKP